MIVKMINGQSLTPLACSVKVKVLNDVISEATTESGGGCRGIVLSDTVMQ